MAPRRPALISLENSALCLGVRLILKPFHDVENVEEESFSSVSPYLIKLAGWEDWMSSYTVGTSLSDHQYYLTRAAPLLTTS